MPCGHRTTRVKICGLTRAEDVQACVEAGVDFVGLNTWPGSSRFVSPETAQALAAELPRDVTPVAVCVWTDPGSVEAALTTGFEWIQVHETPPGWRWQEEEDRHTIVRALKAGEPLQPRHLTGGHYYLVDTPGAHAGGSGQTFDWERIASLRGDDRLFLAGGLHAGNVAEAVAAVAPGAVDVASGVESAPGVKDPTRIAAFVAALERGPEP